MWQEVLRKALAGDIMVAAIMVGDIMGDIMVAVAGVEADVAGWAWGVGTDMVREGPIGQASGTQDFTEHARMVARAQETEPGAVSFQEWDVMIAYSPVTASGAAEAADGGGR